METVITFERGGGYDWDVFFGYYHTGRDRYYYTSGSGCSCNWITDSVEALGDFEDAATKEDMVKAFREYCNGSYGVTQAEQTDGVREILDHRK